MIIDIIREILKDNAATPRLSWPPQSARYTGINFQTLFSHYDARLHTTRLNFSDSYFDGKLITLRPDIKYMLRETYFRNLYIFI